MTHGRKMASPFFIVALLFFTTAVKAQLDVNFCCGDNERLVVRNLGRDKKLAECERVIEAPTSLDGLVVTTGGKDYEVQEGVLRKSKEKRPFCQRGLNVATLIVNGTDTEDNSTIPLFGPDVITLRGSTSPGEGNVYINGEPVCDDSWGENDAKVACRMLGYDSGRATTNSRFGIAPGGDFGMDNVDCNGNEDSLLDCDFSSSDDCSEDEAAGVICGAGDGPAPSVTSVLTPGAGLEVTHLASGSNQTKFVSRGEFCLTQEMSYLEREDEGVVAIFCDRCASEVLCSYTKKAFDAIDYRRTGLIIQATHHSSFVRAGFVTVADTNKDDAVDFDEFLNKTEDYVRIIFDVLDKDDDGSIFEEASRGHIVDKFSLEILENVVVEVLAFFDTNKDDALTQDDEIFDGSRSHSDRNEDGVLTLSEILRVSLISLPAPLYNLYTKVDRNKDEQLTKDEALDFLRRTFILIDTNEDCFIEENEIIELLNRVEVPEDIQLAMRLILKQYLTLGSFLVKEFVEKADVNGDETVTLEDIINFKDFDFIQDMTPAIVNLGSPTGSFSHIINGHRYGPRERHQDFIAMWLTSLQALMIEPVYTGPNPSTQCPGA